MQGKTLRFSSNSPSRKSCRCHRKSCGESVHLSFRSFQALKRCVDPAYSTCLAERKGKPICAHEFLAHGLKYVFPPQRDSRSGGSTPLRRNRSNRAFWRMASLPRFAVCSRKGSRNVACPSLQGSAQSRVARSKLYGFSHSAMQSVWKNAERNSRSNFSERRSMPDPNLPLLEDAVRKLAPFLDEMSSSVELRSDC